MRCWKESCVLENLERAVDLCSRRFGPSQVTAQGQMRRRIILVVEDDLDVARLIRYHLEAAGFGVAVFPDGNSVVSEAKRLWPKLFVLDVILPGSEGFDVCRAIREISSLARVPIIFFVLTARGGEQDRIRGLEIGADDYLSKPFSPRELVARVKTVLRRYSRLRSLPIRVGDVELDARALTLTVRGKEHPTTITELRLLDRFIRNIGHVLSRQELVDYVWEETNDVNTHAGDVHVQRTREKIEEDPANPVYLKTVRG